ncbi:MAG: exodeoxyribonuclease beta subunit, partial [Solirubrobacteraceae bacterium]|nr:exodeoxyribonuclease beta subunit [Solirubrobacteraceae bacterium]
MASLTQTIMLVERLPRRVLARPDGERRLTDLRHVAQLLHGAAATEQLGTTALTAWLRRRIAEADQDTGDEERSRRLESDAEAVQVLTIHRSKGLEFPIVYLPFLWEPGRVPNGKQPVLFHDAGAADARTIDLALQGADFRRHHEQAVVEQRGEDLRLAYVALTRAQHQAVVWWAGSWDSRNSPLGRLLFERDAGGNVAPSGARVPSDTVAAERFAELAAGAPGRIAVERSTLGLPASWAPAPHAATRLAAATLHRSLDASWRRTSYSDITAGTYEPWVASEPELATVTDEPSSPAAVRAADAGGDGDGAPATPSPLGAMPAGLRVGTLVHRVLEATDFTATDLDAELGARMAAAQARRHVEIGDPAIVVAGLRAALETPLGPLLGGARLRDVARADRLDELDFELP